MKDISSSIRPLKPLKLAIIIPAFNAGKTLEDRVFARIPPSIMPRVVNYVVVNNGSTDDTDEALLRLRRRFANLVVLHHKTNKGYGGGEKTLLQYAAKTDAEVIVLLHADGQYAPEEIPNLIEPFQTANADIVQGSRMMNGRAALKGGMPLYKFVSNRVLTAIENIAFGMKMADFHSGYMLYSQRVLQAVPYDKLANNFCFDAEMLVMAKIRGLTIVQRPIPTHYGDEVSHLKSIPYGINVLKTIWRYMRGYYHGL